MLDDITYSSDWEHLAAFPGEDVFITLHKIFYRLDYLAVAQETLEFLEKVSLQNGYFKPVRCKGWMPRAKEPAFFDEQPVEACEMVLAYLEGYKVPRRKNTSRRLSTSLDGTTGSIPSRHP